MQLFSSLQQMLVRFRYPVSMPQEVASSLGVQIENNIPFQSFLTKCRTCRPSRLSKFMPRMEAERAFQGALRKERFSSSSLYSFYFNEGWLEFELQFDTNSLLRRLYVHHKLIDDPGVYELTLDIDEQPLLHIQNDTADSLFIA